MNIFLESDKIKDLNNKAKYKSNEKLKKYEKFIKKMQSEYIKNFFDVITKEKKEEMGFLDYDYMMLSFKECISSIIEK